MIERTNAPSGSPVTRPILEVEHVSRSFVVGRHIGRPPDLLRAVVDVSLSVRAGSALGIVGESGSGKTTLARIIVRLLDPDRGRVVMDGVDLTRLRGSSLRAARRPIQMVFQDPSSSLNPRVRIGAAIEEPLRAHGIVPPGQVDQARDSLLERVGLNPGLSDRLPRELSGGQRQRVSIARALSVRPRILVADEPVSMLDVSVRAQILNLLADLRDQDALTQLFISHDLSVVHHLTDQVAVMYFGRLVEYGPTRDVLRAGAHPYTRALAEAIPHAVAGGRRAEPALRGELPSAIQPIQGCVFQSRCPMVAAICAEEPPRVQLAEGHWAACHFASPASVAPTPSAASTTDLPTAPPGGRTPLAPMIDDVSVHHSEGTA
jgi:oligopeptide/dipeptide ABC transporter ATP-binding protein